jgi:hypothetical protein
MRRAFERVCHLLEMDLPGAHQEIEIVLTVVLCGHVLCGHSARSQNKNQDAEA